MFDTLQDFSAHSKGAGYLIAGLVLLLLVPFWMFLNKKATRKRG